MTSVQTSKVSNTLDQLKPSIVLDSCYLAGDFWSSWVILLEDFCKVILQSVLPLSQSLWFDHSNSIGHSVNILCWFSSCNSHRTIFRGSDGISSHRGLYYRRGSELREPTLLLWEVSIPGLCSTRRHNHFSKAAHFSKGDTITFLKLLLSKDINILGKKIVQNKRRVSD